MMTIHEHFGHFKGLKVLLETLLIHAWPKSNMELLTRLGAEVTSQVLSTGIQVNYDKYGKYEKLDKLVPEMEKMS